MAEKPTVGILGKGNMAQAFLDGLGRTGYRAAASGRDHEELRRVAAGADVVILAVPYVRLAEVIPIVASSLRGKIVVDITNLMGPNHTFLGDGRQSGAERLQALLPDARVVKAFNTVFSSYLAGGHVAGEALTAFVAGNDAGARGIVMQMARDLGLDPVDCGPLDRAGALESMGWLHVAIFESVGWDHGLRLVRALPEGS